jgi:hypothetical protein
MSEERRRLSDGIEIDREIAEAEGVPDDLDAWNVGTYRFPDPRRRRLAGWIYGALFVILAILALGTPGYWVMTGVVAVVAIWHVRSAWSLGIDQEEALERAAASVDFAVGHASAAVTFRGLRSRPTWHVIVYSADEPPSRRALVQFDAVDGEQIADVYTERVPETA